MTDDRPRPQYGEYATPEQQAAAMGRGHEVPRSAEPVTRVAETLAATPHAVSGNEDDRLRPGGNAIDRFATIFQLGIGLVFLLDSNYFQFSQSFNAAVSEFGIGRTVPASLDRFGWLMLAVNIVLYGATAFWAYTRIRRARLAFFVPIIGFVAFNLFQSALVLFVIYG